jgi:hypothetical protein
MQFSLMLLAMSIPLVISVALLILIRVLAL